MKKTLMAVASVAMAVALTGCGGSPSDVAEDFVNAIIQKDPGAAVGFFDTVTGAFRDPSSIRLRTDKEIKKLKDEGTTIVLSTHNMASVEEICDHIALINRSRKILEGDIFEVKNRFKKNLYSIETTRLPEVLLQQLEEQKYGICSQFSNDYYTRLEVKIPEGRTANNLLQLIMQHTDIHAFNEIMPTMSEIFIEQVELANQQPDHEE